MGNIVIIGATSSIAQATAKVYARKNANMYLLGRDGDKLSTVTTDLKIRGAKSVGYRQFDAAVFEKHSEDIDSAFKDMGTVDVVLVAHGTLPNQVDCEKDAAQAVKELHINGSGTLSLLIHVANKLEKQGQGTLAVITSVAGDRGKQSNYIYGAAKAMVSTFLQGLRGRLCRSGVHVLDIKPGFVDTPMTKDFKKGLLWAKPESVAHTIVRAIEKKKNVVYTPWFWIIIMLIIRNIPENIFKKTRL